MKKGMKPMHWLFVAFGAAIFLIVAGSFMPSSVYGSPPTSLKSSDSLGGRGLRCVNECSPSGVQQCAPANSSGDIMVCGNFDSDSCLEWAVQAIECQYGCVNGSCASGPNYSIQVINNFGNNGLVVSSPSGINCGSGSNQCINHFGSNILVSLTATPSPGYSFGGWDSQGVCAGQGPVCTIFMNWNYVVYANFVQQNQTNSTHLACVNNMCSVVSGAGNNTCSPQGSQCGNITNQTYVLSYTNYNSFSGTLSVNPIGVVGSCSGGSNGVLGCNNIYNSGTSVTVTATPNSGAIFAGWSGACSGTGSCVVLMNANQNVGGNFTNSTNSSLADLTVTNLTIMNKTFTHNNGTGNGTNYYSVFLIATVRNIGTASSGASTTRIGVDGFNSDNVATGSLAPGASTIVTRTIQNIAQGTRTARATADINGVVSESNEGNNIKTQNFTVP